MRFFLRLGNIQTFEMVWFLYFWFIRFKGSYSFDVITWFARSNIHQSLTNLRRVIWNSCRSVLIISSLLLRLVCWRWVNLLKLLIDLFSDDFRKLVSLDLKFVPQLAKIGFHVTWLLLVFYLIQNILKHLVFLNLSYMTLLHSFHHLKSFL